MKNKSKKQNKMASVPISEIDNYISAAEQWVNDLQTYRNGLEGDEVDIGSNPPPPPPPPPGS